MKTIGVHILLAAFFLLELVAFGALGYWGYHIGSGAAVRTILMVATPLAVAILWGMFLSPKASLPVFAFPTRTALKLVVFIAASAALYTAGSHVLGVVLLMASIVMAAAVFVLNLHNV